MAKEFVGKPNPFRAQFAELDDEGFTIETIQDAEPILEDAKRAYNDYGDKLTPGKRGEWHRVMSVPFSLWERWMQETGGAIEKDPALMRKYLNDPDFKYFKTAPTNL